MSLFVNFCLFQPSAWVFPWHGMKEEARITVVRWCLIIGYSIILLQSSHPCSRLPLKVEKVLPILMTLNILTATSPRVTKHWGLQLQCAQFIMWYVPFVINAVYVTNSVRPWPWWITSKLHVVETNADAKRPKWLCDASHLIVLVANKGHDFLRCVALRCVAGNASH